MKRLVIGALILGLLTGCKTQSVKEARVEAYKRWHHARAKVLYGVGVEQLKVGQLGGAREKAMEAVALDEEYLPARILLGKVCVEQGHYALGIEVFEKVLKQVPDSQEAIYLLAVAQEKDGRIEQALANYRRAHRLNTKNMGAVKAAAEVLVVMGRIREAQLQLESYIYLGSDDPGMYELAGRIAMMQEQYDGAARYYEQACDLDYRNVRYREALARAQFLSQRYGETIDTLSTLMNSKDYHPAAWVHTMLGDSYMEMNRPYDARNAYHLALQQRPEFGPVRVALGKVAVAVNDLPRAILSAREALQLEPGSLDATLLLGYALLRSGQGGEALEVFNRAVKDHPNNQTVRCLLGRAHAVTGNDAEATRCFLTVLKADPDNELARRLLGRCTLSKGPL